MIPLMLVNSILIYVNVKNTYKLNKLRIKHIPCRTSCRNLHIVCKKYIFYFPETIQNLKFTRFNPFGYNSRTIDDRVKKFTVQHQFGPQLNKEIFASTVRSARIVFTPMRSVSKLKKLVLNYHFCR